MTPTIELRGRLRKYLNELIPQGKTDIDTNFTDVELDELLTDAATVFGAASVGWAIKTGLIQGQIEKYTVGQETYSLTSLKDQMAHSLAMSERYASMGLSGSNGSIMARVKEPDVI